MRGDRVILSTNITEHFPLRPAGNDAGEIDEREAKKYQAETAALLMATSHEKQN